MQSLLLVLLASTSFAAVAPEYAGSATCIKCHATQSAAQATTGHAHALTRSTPEQPGEWAFGAGAQAITFVSHLDRITYLEHGGTWYPGAGTYGITPGHLNSDGLRYRTFDPAAQMLRCFACHTTGPLNLGEEDAITPSELGVRCEVCHGPAAAHVASPAAFHTRNPLRMTAVQINSLCGTCHRALAWAEETTDLRDPWNSRHQPLLLAASQCFLKSNGRLSCLTCHSPHRPLEQKAVSYNRVCTSCHAAPRHSQRIVGQACATCHMPAVKPNDFLTFSNHRIGIYAANDPLSPPGQIRMLRETRGPVSPRPAAAPSGADK